MVNGSSLLCSRSFSFGGGSWKGLDSFPSGIGFQNGNQMLQTVLCGVGGQSFR